VQAQREREEAQAQAEREREEAAIQAQREREREQAALEARRASAADAREALDQIEATLNVFTGTSDRIEQSTNETLAAVDRATRRIDEIVIGQRGSTEQSEETLAAATQRLLRLTEHGLEVQTPA
jgi:hypothetical protein